MRKVVEIEVEADALSISGVIHLTQSSVVAALRRIADDLESAGSHSIAPEQFRAAASAFEDLDATDAPRRPGLLRRWWRGEP